MNSIVTIKNNQNNYCMKDIKVEQNVLDETISTENSYSNEKNKGTNLKKVINFYDYTNDKVNYRS